VPVKVEQMNAYLFSDTVKINKNKKWKEDESIRSVGAYTGDIRPSGRGGRGTKEEKTSERNELQVFCRRQMEIREKEKLMEMT
jgi:hypothetical protein